MKNDLSFTDIFKVMAGVAGGISLFKSIQEWNECIQECKENYDNHIKQNFGDTESIDHGTVHHDTTSQELRKDSINALVNLGYKTKDSKERVEDAIQNGNCKTIQDIIRYVLINKKN